ncbi:bifunctional glutamate N-acetyltransferase/amino-acid acetyltransferase ArgJ [Sinanaerobacter chloroacetimidivorans]|uniref:Arginine biosynthesis bifunctional protein ArgJ n=1 Tax=Sinanaerobacter chloroacetimidivorans TaxID=2818044 RepID=A0A8J7W692_9FIRM|nr:bifunctional glutamate N-acetyltransferase/amino-acid acetyltransferase ArgJ [Sinanaerobacter chloroacetimidivorans]MBR0599690.1 bifunctional glutamate N-acetyltransferase/amino-acid acetyltransferase ArgJ [Sinanaerobacter chloroacetimidivorans]
MYIEYINGGVCAPKGFQASGVHCGIRRNKTKKDLALIVSDVMCNAAAIYTTNKVKGAPITVTQHNIQDGRAKAVICNSGNANTCAPNGIEIAKQTCGLLAKELGIKPEDIIISSTGVIGMPLSIEPFETGIPKLVKKLSYEGSDMAAHGIMTTDTLKKECAVSVVIGNKVCHIGGIAKGSGMIHPNMATMLCYLTTDVEITPEMLKKALLRDVADTFNQVSVDGDTSTNDTVAIMANGLAGNTPIDSEGEDFDEFCKALNYVTAVLAKAIAKDGEGATKLLECIVSGAPDKQTARVISKSVITSSLFKSAMFGEDANWGRALCAIGYADAQFDVTKVDIVLSSSKGNVEVCKGAGYNFFSEEEASQILGESEIKILVSLNQGDEKARAWGCDLTYNYVKINGNYRT